MSKMNLEQFKEFAKTLPDGANKRRIAKVLEITLPLEMQLEEVELVKEEEVKKGEEPKTYVHVPPLTLEDGTKTGYTRVQAKVARKVAERILQVCDENNL